MKKDYYHETVKTALEKDGWTITYEPLTINVLEAKLEIDLTAEKIVTATKGLEKIAIEIKGFQEDSSIYAFHRALGQYLNYHFALMHKHPEYQLYLAIPIDVYLDFFQIPFIKEIVQLHKIKLIAFHPITKSIESWERNQ